MTIKQIIKQEQDKTIALLINQIISLKWSQRFVDKTPEEIKNLDVEKADDEQKKAHKLYKNHLENLDKTLEVMQENALAYKDLSNCEDAINKLLK